MESPAAPIILTGRVDLDAFECTPHGQHSVGNYCNPKRVRAYVGDSDKKERKLRLPAKLEKCPASAQKVSPSVPRLRPPFRDQILQGDH
jgi:hypothetical protein